MIKMFIESMKNLVSKPVTIKYPFEPSPEPKGYRGTILYNEDDCIFCDKCENICPPGAIKFEVVDVESGKKQYNYNPYLCIYCGACVSVCPKTNEALTQSEKRMPPLGRTVYKEKALGYFMNEIENPKELEKKWGELEIRAEESREKLAEYKKQKRLKAKADKAKQIIQEVKQTRKL
jgi:ech hydrogenase subunit F